jgi:hypothetical protein
MMRFTFVESYRAASSTVGKAGDPLLILRAPVQQQPVQFAQIPSGFGSNFGFAVFAMTLSRAPAKKNTPSKRHGKSAARAFSPWLRHFPRRRHSR